MYYKPRQKPGLVVWKDDIANLYLLIKIGSSSNKNNKPLSNVLSSQSTPHFIYSRPFLAKRKDLGSKPFWIYI